MKIITAAQSKTLDLESMKREPISSLDLMERAGKKLYELILKNHGTEKNYKLLCGNGNNGGDGLVVARLLFEKGCNVQVYTDLDAENKSEESQENFSRLKKRAIPIADFSAVNEIENAVWIDALFGSGLNRPLKGNWAEIIKKINSFTGIKMAIDIPSGLFSDKINQENDVIFKADETYSIGQPKLTFFLPEAGKFIGDFKILDIGLSKSFLQEIETPFFYSRQKEVQKIFKPRKRFSHKGSFGHALVIGGSYGKMGAAVIATKAALKSGAGLVSSYTPKCGYEIMQISVPEAMAMTDENKNFIQSFPPLKNFNSIGIGPGLDTQEATKSAFYKSLKEGLFQDKKIVLDADALNLLSLEKNYLEVLPPHSILTPHPKEFERLTHSTQSTLDRLELAREFAYKHQIILVLKDAFTSIISPDAKVYFNATGNAALATGGSGDALTGIITGLLAQNYSPLDAAKLGVWLHGKSADIGLKDESKESFTATDIFKNIGKAFKAL